MIKVLLSYMKRALIAITTVNYVYDASGRKLRKIVDTTTIEYAVVIKQLIVCLGYLKYFMNMLL